MLQHLAGINSLNTKKLSISLDLTEKTQIQVKIIILFLRNSSFGEEGRVYKNIEVNANRTIKS